MNVDAVLRFVLGLAMAPVVVKLGRGVRIPRARMAFLIGYLAIVASFGMTLMTFETWAIAFRFARHLLFAVGGFAFAWAAWRLRGHILATTGDPR